MELRSPIVYFAADGPFSKAERLGLELAFEKEKDELEAVQDLDCNQLWCVPWERAYAYACAWM
jgi:hypothetical protein